MFVPHKYLSSPFPLPSSEDESASEISFGERSDTTASTATTTATAAPADTIPSFASAFFRTPEPAPTLSSSATASIPATPATAVNPNPSPVVNALQRSIAQSRQAEGLRFGEEGFGAAASRTGGGVSSFSSGGGVAEFGVEPVPPDGTLYDPMHAGGLARRVLSVSVLPNGDVAVLLEVAMSSVPLSSNAVLQVCQYERQEPPKAKHTLLDPPVPLPPLHLVPATSEAALSAPSITPPSASTPSTSATPATDPSALPTHSSPLKGVPHPPSLPSHSPVGASSPLHESRSAESLVGLSSSDTPAGSGADGVDPAVSQSQDPSPGAATSAGKQGQGGAKDASAAAPPSSLSILPSSASPLSASYPPLPPPPPQTDDLLFWLFPLEHVIPPAGGPTGKPPAPGHHPHYHHLHYSHPPVGSAGWTAGPLLPSFPPSASSTSGAGGGFQPLVSQTLSLTRPASTPTAPSALPTPKTLTPGASGSLLSSRAASGWFGREELAIAGPGGLPLKWGQVEKGHVGWEGLLSFRAVGLEPQRFSGQAGQLGPFVPGRKWSQGVAVLQPLKVESYACECNLVDRICVSVEVRMHMGMKWDDVICWSRYLLFSRLECGELRVQRQPGGSEMLPPYAPPMPKLPLVLVPLEFVSVHISPCSPPPALPSRHVPERAPSIRSHCRHHCLHRQPVVGRLDPWRAGSRPGSSRAGGLRGGGSAGRVAAGARSPVRLAGCCAHVWCSATSQSLSGPVKCVREL